MKSFRQLLLTSIIILGVLNCTDSEINDSNENLKLFYNHPAEKWTDALPVGNGRLGAMVFGGIVNERIQLNEESLWAGCQINNNNPEASKHLNEIQHLLLLGKNSQATKLAGKYLLGTPHRIRSYQSLGDLELKFNHELDSISNYRRELDLSTGINSTSYKSDETIFRREVFASAVDNIIVVHITSEGESKINLTIDLKRELDAYVKILSENSMTLSGQINDIDEPHRGPLGKHMKFSTLLKVFNTDGSTYSQNNSLIVKNATEIKIILTAATDYNIKILNFDRSIIPTKICDEIISKAESKSIDELILNHIKDHQSIFNRVSINLDDDEYTNLSTDVRLQRIKDGKEDAGLLSLYFQYGRYLLMSSSRSPGVLPANLQGIWNEHMDAPWNSDFHTNINLQMNYWPADICNLPETVVPLSNYFTRLLVPGRVTANEMYNASGWMMHHVTDPFGRTGLMDGVRWGTSPLAGAWMTLTFWRHFQFTRDEDYLRNTAYPILKEASQFVLDFLIEDKDGYLVTAPSMSPENTFINPLDKKKNQLTYSATIDIQIINELFNACIKSAQILGIDPDFIFHLEETLPKLPPVKIGNDGTIREWIEDYEEAEPGHRHMSHLFGLYPGTKITSETPKLFNAAKLTIEKRLANGGGHTGWSRAWIVNFYARLLDGENAYLHLLELVKKSTLTNLFDNHPPFQIDGNFGGTAGIAEMLLQSQNDLIHILPALPKAWKKGNIKGLMARGNFIVDINWREGELKELIIKSLSGGPCSIKYKDRKIQIDSKAGQEYRFNSNLEL